VSVFRSVPDTTSVKDKADELEASALPVSRQAASGPARQRTLLRRAAAGRSRVTKRGERLVLVVLLKIVV